MPTVEKVRGGEVLIRGLGQRFSVGDQAGVNEEMATYLCEERGDFAIVEGVTDVEFEDAGEDDAEDGPDYTSIPPNLEDATYDELMEVARDQDVSGRSSMDKDELIDALREE